MINKLLASSIFFAALAGSSFAATTAGEFYVAQNAKTHACMVVNAKPDGKTAMDAGNKSYASEANAKQAMSALKACAAPAMAAAPKPAPVVTPAKPVVAAVLAKPVAATKLVAAAAPAAGSFYVEQDAKSHQCMVADSKPDGKKMVDVGTKVYETEGRAKQAMAMLKVCKS